MNKVLSIISNIFKMIMALTFIFFGIFMHATTINYILIQAEKRKYSAPCQYIKVYDNKRMHICIYGNGPRTLVMMPGLGTPSPAVDFNPMARMLSDKFRVVIIEPFGYGWSDNTEIERSSTNIVNESRTALRTIGLTAPYILIAHSASGLYDIAWQKNYPDEVSALIGLDTSVPAQINQLGVKQKFNKNLFPLLTKMGVFRIYYTFFPDRELSNYYNSQEKELELSMYSSVYLNSTVINEQNKFYDNLFELREYKYPSNLPVINFLSNESVSSKEFNMDWLKIHQDLVTNGNIQKNIVLNGGHYIHHTNNEKIVHSIEDFIDNLKIF